MSDINSDFCITIDFDKKSENPSRVFQTMSELINAFQKFDSDLICGINTQLKPTILLEDVETGSLKTWLSTQIKGIPDEVLKEGEWKKILGHYLLKAKYILINKLENRVDISDAKTIEDIQNELSEEAKRTDLKLMPYYEPLPIPKLIRNIENMNNALSYLNDNDKAYFETKDQDRASFNLTLNFSPETIEDLLTKEAISNESITILKIKKPDYLGSSMWDFMHNRKQIPAKILDQEWLLNFQRRKIDIRPGDSIRARINTVVKYGHDNNVIGISYEVIEVLEILPLKNVISDKLFDDEPDSVQ
ncbi:MAG: hypothetical protein M0Q12_12655 [Synergistaceae bacterium]|jgi:hypothetical protein|nr:hypothetical protein [Synergistaceae bacterium]